MAGRIEMLRDRIAPDGRGTWAAFATATKTSHATIQNMVNGLRSGARVGASASTMRRIQLATGCSAEWLYEGKGEPFPDKPLTPFEVVATERQWHPGVLGYLTKLRDDGIRDDVRGWRRRFQAAQKAAEPTPPPPVSEVVAKAKPA